MAKPKQIILTEEGVITQEALLAYAEGRLGAAESAQMEKLLADDPFAQEAMEGMRESSAKMEMSAAITTLNTQLREKTGARERKKKGIEIHWVNYAYAAVVLGVLVGFGYVMIHILAANNNDLAENKNVPQGQESVPVIQAQKDTIKPDTTVTMQNIAADSTTRTTDLEDTMVSPEPDTRTPTSTPSGNTSIPTTGSTTTNKNNAAALTPSATNSKEEVAPMKNKSAALSVANAADASGKDAADSKYKKAAATERKPMDKKDVDAAAAQLLSAKSYFDSGDYVNAEKKYKEVLLKLPNNLDALYFGGVSAYLNGTWGLGEGNFDKLLKSGAYTEGSKWYKANILIVKGQKDEAKKLLREIINSGSIYKERAVKRYEELLK